MLIVLSNNKLTKLLITMKKYQVLIVGDGYIASNLKIFLKKKKINFKFLKKKYFVKKDLINIVSNNNFKTAIILFGKTSIKFCQKNKIKSFQVNVKKTNQIIKILLRKKIKTIYLSTDLVFSGNRKLYYPNTKPDGNLEYAKQKILVENKFKDKKNFAVLRISKIIEKDFNFFIKKEKTKINIKTCSPILLRDVLSIISKMIKNFKSGIFQFSSKPIVSNKLFLKKKKIKFKHPVMQNNIFKHYKKTSEITDSKKIIKIAMNKFYDS